MSKYSLYFVGRHQSGRYGFGVALCSTLTGAIHEWVATSLPYPAAVRMARRLNREHGYDS